MDYWNLTIIFTSYIFHFLPSLILGCLPNILIYCLSRLVHIIIFYSKCVNFTCILFQNEHNLCRSNQNPDRSLQKCSNNSIEVSKNAIISNCPLQEKTLPISNYNYPDCSKTQLEKAQKCHQIVHNLRTEFDQLSQLTISKTKLSNFFKQEQNYYDWSFGDEKICVQKYHDFPWGPSHEIDFWQELNNLLICLIILVVFSITFRLIQRLIFIKLAKKLNSRLHLRLFENLINKNRVLNSHLSNNPNFPERIRPIELDTVTELSSRLNYIDQIETFTQKSLPKLLRSLSGIAGALIISFVIDYRAILFAVFLVILVQFISKKIFVGRKEHFQNQINLVQRKNSTLFKQFLKFDDWMNYRMNLTTKCRDRIDRHRDLLFSNQGNQDQNLDFETLKIRDLAFFQTNQEKIKENFLAIIRIKSMQKLSYLMVIFLLLGINKFIAAINLLIYGQKNGQTFRFSDQQINYSTFFILIYMKIMLNLQVFDKSLSRTKQVFEKFKKLRGEIDIFEEENKKHADLLEFPEMVKNSPSSLMKMDFRGKIEFRNVYFGLEGKLLLRNASFIIHFDQLTVLFEKGLNEFDGSELESNCSESKDGSNESIVSLIPFSKTSCILRLIVKLYKPDSGKILIDDLPLEDYNLDYLRSKILMISETPLIDVNLSIKDNLLLGVNNLYRSPGLLEAAIVQCCQWAGCYEFIMALPGRFETVLGDEKFENDYSSLIFGELQKLNMARALLKKPNILIIDSNALSQISLTYKNTLYEKLADKNDIMTVIINNNDDYSILEKSDQVILVEDLDNLLSLENDQIICGTHAELLEMDVFGYRQIYEEHNFCRLNYNLMEEEEDNFFNEKFDGDVHPNNIHPTNFDKNQQPTSKESRKFLSTIHIFIQNYIGTYRTIYLCIIITLRLALKFTILHNTLVNIMSILENSSEWTVLQRIYLLKFMGVYLILDPYLTKKQVNVLINLFQEFEVSMVGHWRIEIYN